MMPSRSLVLFAACLIVSGCAGNQATTGSISPIRAPTDDFKTTVAQGVVAGAIVGGLAGALTGGGDSKRILEGALIGGGVGLVGGYLIAGQKQAYANKEDALNAVLADTQQRNDKLTRILATTDQVIVRRRADLANLQASTGAAQQKVAAQKQLLADLEEDKAALNHAIELARDNGKQIDQNVAELKKQFPDEKTRPIDGVAGTYRHSAQSLEQKPSELFRMIDETSKIRAET